MIAPPDGLPDVLQDDLPRKLSLLDATLVVIGVVIGSGIFLLPNLVARNLPSAGAMIAVWLAAGILSFFGALAYAELGAMMPATGGQYVYLREAYGSWCAFLSGWVFVLAAVPGGIAFLAVGFSMYLDRFIPLTSGMRTVVSLGLLTVLSVVNYIGVRQSAWVQGIFTTLKIAGLLVIVGAALFSSPVAHTAPEVASHISYAGAGIAMAACLMAYNGWSYVSFVAGEVKNPGRSLPRSLAFGMGAVMVLYISTNLAYLKVLTVSQIAASERVGADVAARVLGSAGASALSVIVLFSIIGAINGCILAGARIPFAQARDGLFFSRFGHIHPRFKTPSFAIAAQAVWTAVLIVSGSYEILSSYTILSAWLFYTLGAAAVWVLRRKMPNAQRPYRMWGYPLTLFLFLIVSVWFILDAMVNQPIPSLMALFIAAAGIPFYFYWRRSSALKPEPRQPSLVKGPN
jgi:basic amino acid/polyamine antiporter, APA family